MISSLASKCQDFTVEMLFFQPLYVMKLKTECILSFNINLTYAHVPAISKAVNNAVMMQWNDAKKTTKIGCQEP
jgi:hypothetical protein